MRQIYSPLLVLFLLLAIGGCSSEPMRFRKDGVSEQELQREAAGCIYDVKSKNVGRNFGTYLSNGKSELVQLIEYCMQGKGYTVVSSPPLW